MNEGMTSCSLCEARGRSASRHTVVSIPGSFPVPTGPLFCKFPYVRKIQFAFRMPAASPSFLERIAFAETALWGDACAAPDSGVTLFIAPLPEHVVTLKARASSQHLAPGSPPFLSLQRRPKAEIHGVFCAVLRAV